MRFSIQEERKEKKVFYTLGEAQKETGIDARVIFSVLKKDDTRYRRRCDKKNFYIQEENDEKMFIIDGEDIF